MDRKGPNEQGLASLVTVAPRRAVTGGSRAKSLLNRTQIPELLSGKHCVQTDGFSYPLTAGLCGPCHCSARVLRCCWDKGQRECLSHLCKSLPFRISVQEGAEGSPRNQKGTSRVNEHSMFRAAASKAWNWGEGVSLEITDVNLG